MKLRWVERAVADMWAKDVGGAPYVMATKTERVLQYFEPAYEGTTLTGNWVDVPIAKEGQ